MRAQELERYIDDFESYNLSRNLSPKTVESYRRALNAFFRWIERDGGLDTEVNARLIRKWVSVKLKQGRKPNTLRSYQKTLRALFSFLVRDQIIAADENPMQLVKDVRVPQDEIRPLSEEEVKRLLDSFDRDNPLEHRNYTICLLMLECGLRVGEVVRLKVQDIDFDKRQIRVNGKGQRNRMAFFGHKMQETLADYIEKHKPVIERRNGTLFPPAKRSQNAMMRAHYLSMVIREKMRDAGVYTPHSSSHRLRHTCAVSLIRKGASAFHVQRILGHCSLEMTRRYVQLVDGDLSDLYETASPVDGLEL